MRLTGNELTPYAGGEGDPGAVAGERTSRFKAALVRPLRPTIAEPVPGDLASTRELLLDVSAELAVQSALLRELVQVDSGESIAVPVRIVLSSTKPFYTFNVDSPAQFHAVKIDNPAVAPGTLEVLYSGQQPSVANSDERVPARTGRILVRPIESLSIGFDPANVPAGSTPVYVTFYSRPLQPAAYPFAP